MAFAEVADVSDASVIAPLVKRCAEQMGGLDGLVLNVGISRGLPLARQTAADWDFEYAVNVRSHMLFCQAALEVMPEGSSIVLMSSLASLRAGSRNPAYESSKAAQVALARSVAVAGEAKGIRCNAVLPGLMDTPMGRDATRHRPGRAVAVPWGRQGTGWEVAYACLYLISHESSYCNAHALLLDGGCRWASPGLPPRARDRRSRVRSTPTARAARPLRRSRRPAAPAGVRPCGRPPRANRPAAR